MKSPIGYSKRFASQALSMSHDSRIREYLGRVSASSDHDDSLQLGKNSLEALTAASMATSYRPAILDQIAND